ncbi:hypothetical protein ABIB68_003173 [Bradyrhizobium sp. F1.2.2]|jgi:hypothetical protein
MREAGRAPKGLPERLNRSVVMREQTRLSRAARSPRKLRQPCDTLCPVVIAEDIVHVEEDELVPPVTAALSDWPNIRP